MSGKTSISAAKSFRKETVAALALLLGVCFAGVIPADAAGKVGSGVAQSKHNLSISGSGALRANAVSTDTAAGEMCIFCHTPHSAGRTAALWNHSDSSTTYIPYGSSTTKAIIGQPTGASRLCLSCHDGTVALGMVRNRRTPIAMKSVAATMPRSRSNLGTDLSDDHPVSFQYTAALAAKQGDLQSPPRSGSVRLDANGEMQCTTCHDPHEDAYGKFLVMDNTGSALCLTCHNPEFWMQSAHGYSPKRWNGLGVNPWPHTSQKTVAANGCENCHSPHTAGGKQRLLNYAEEEQNCYPCHNGNVATKNIQAEFGKASVHPVINTTGVHDPAELTLVSAGTTRHVECADCHNPHAASATGKTKAGAVSGALAGVRGVNVAGAKISQITYEYELCFRCHADTAKGPARVSRQFPQLNTRLEFQDASGQNSFHPVVLTGRNPSVPSLRQPWTIASLMTCGDCHNNDGGTGAGGTGPAGPHGSAYAPLLERPMSFADTAANSANSALCYKCHNFGNAAWRDHTRHVGYTACGTCHDPHGSPNAHLMNFDPSVVLGARSYKSTGTGHGTCTLTCHGREHAATSY